jgi:CheY-like chemotaxis protein
MSRDKDLILAASIAHETKNTLETIIDSLGIVIEQPGRLDLVHIALGQAKLIDSLVRSMLSMAKSNAVAPMVNEEVFAIDSLLTSIRDAYQVTAESNGIVLRIDRPDPDPKPVCRGNALFLKQVLNNLVANALKFTNPGGSITLGACEKANGIFRFYVQDTGAGMSLQTRNRLFQLFEQAPETASLGTGLGLYLCRELVTFMQGNVSVESELGKGSIFNVEVPLKIEEGQGQPGSATTVVTATITKPPQPVSASSSPQKKRTVLIVDDEPGIRKLYSQIFGSFGGECTAIATSCEGLHLAVNGVFDLVIVDMTLGDGNGLDFISQLRKRTAFHPNRIFVALVTGALVDAVAVFKAGADSILEKPCGVERLKALWQGCFGSADQSGTAAA